MLTTDQLQALATDIAADPAFEGVPHNSDGAFLVAAAYNLDADPAWYVWRTNVPTSDCKIAMDWVEYIALSDGERDAWRFMLINGILNAGDINVREGIAQIFKGPNGEVSRTALLVIAKRTATRAEKLFATGTGTELIPATMTFEGSLSYRDVMKAWE